MCDDGVGGEEQAVGYLAVGHTFDYTDDDLFLARTQSLLFVCVITFFFLRVQALQFMLQLVGTVEDADLIVVLTGEGMVRECIKQGETLHIRASGHLF